MKHNDCWTLYSFVDSDWGGDKDNRRSVTGWDFLLEDA